MDTNTDPIYTDAKVAEMRASGFPGNVRVADLIADFDPATRDRIMADARRRQNAVPGGRWTDHVRAVIPFVEVAR